MDRQRSGFDGSGDTADAPGIEPPPVIGQDERRMHVRAYNYWAKLLEGRSFPSIESLDVEDMGDFGPHALLLDFTSGIENPAIIFVGDTLAKECQLDESIQYIAEVPRKSLLSRLTDHYLQIIANRAPIGFEAEFVNERGATILYRGVLLPFSSDDDTIDFIMGVINWKQAAEPSLNRSIADEMAAASLATHAPRATMPVWSDGPDTQAHEASSSFASLSGGLIDAGDLGAIPFPQDDAELADRLADARCCAELATEANARGHAALYQAIGRAWAFAIAAKQSPDDYAELLDMSGIKASARAPMTPVVKLVFGADHDKTRLAEYAAVLTHASERDIPPEELPTVLSSAPGGLKGLLKDIRAARRKATDDGETRDPAQMLRTSDALAIIDLPQAESSGDYVALLARREADGRLAIIAHASGGDPATERLMRSAAKAQRTAI